MAATSKLIVAPSVDGVTSRNVAGVVVVPDFGLAAGSRGPESPTPSSTSASASSGSMKFATRCSASLVNSMRHSRRAERCARELAWPWPWPWAPPRSAIDDSLKTLSPSLRELGPSMLRRPDATKSMPPAWKLAPVLVADPLLWPLSCPTERTMDRSDSTRDICCRSIAASEFMRRLITDTSLRDDTPMDGWKGTRFGRRAGTPATFATTGADGVADGAAASEAADGEKGGSRDGPTGDELRDDLDPPSSSTTVVTPCMLCTLSPDPSFLSGGGRFGPSPRPSPVVAASAPSILALSSLPVEGAVSLCAEVNEPADMRLRIDIIDDMWPSDGCLRYGAAGTLRYFTSSSNSSTTRLISCERPVRWTFLSSLSTSLPLASPSRSALRDISRCGANTSIGSDLPLTRMLSSA
mmetsp:Transcript_998/g.3170  ORF Transcript_998/g.3170 Transcript_998/m.3170 type:complete len:410 (+) Transcript_998:143-1372(+)